jgi:ribonuclease VapC
LIVDTSVLVAIATGESDWEGLLRAISTDRAIIPAPVLTELQLATGRQGSFAQLAAAGLVDRMLANGHSVAPYERRHAEITATARESYGKGNGRGGLLNFGDLMVYAMAKELDEPLLCTGRDFTTTDLQIHPASRPSP